MHKEKQILTRKSSYLSFPRDFNDLHRASTCSLPICLVILIWYPCNIHALLLGRTKQHTLSIFPRYAPLFRCPFHTSIAPNTFLPIMGYDDHTPLFFRSPSLKNFFLAKKETKHSQQRQLNQSFHIPAQFPLPDP